MGASHQSITSKSLAIACDTWVKDSHGLFDYEARQITSRALYVSEAAKVVRCKQEVSLHEKDAVLDKTNEETKGLANIGVIRDQFWVYSSAPASPVEEQLWIVLRNYVGEDGMPGHKLREGDVVKMGRCKYLVRELVRAPEAGKSLENNMENTLMDAAENNMVSSVILVQKFEEPPRAPSEKLSVSQSTAKKGEEKTCRICLCEDNDPTNALIESPCACTGSVRLMHINCLKHWLQSKVTEKRTDYSVSYSWKQFECEVCKTKYPDRFTTPDGQLLDIIKIEKPSSNYMVLEADITSTNGLRVIHVIYLDKKDVLKIGRGHETDVRVSDISVSRNHAEIRRIGTEYYLVDLNSKFGTLILATKPLRVRISQGLTLQAGRTLLRISMIVPSYCLCFKQKVVTEEEPDPSEKELTSIMKRPTQVDVPPEALSEVINVQPVQVGENPGISSNDRRDLS